MNRIKIRQGLPLLVAAGADGDFAQVGLQSWGIAKRLKISVHITYCATFLHFVL